MLTDETTTADDVVLAVDDLHVHHRVRGAMARRGEVRAVDGVDLTVRRGEIVGLVGESGSGKSSVALTACALQRPTSGTVQVAGRDLTKMRGSALRRARADVQMVFQDPVGALDPRQSVGRGFAELRKLHPERTAQSTDVEILRSVDLPSEILGRLPHQLSGGQAQRVSLARALMLQPIVLIADEPTSALDVSVQAQILTLLDEMRAERHLGILFISHDLAVVQQLCSVAHVMRHGKIVESGTPDRLFRQPQHPYTQQLVAAVPGAHAVLAGGVS